MPIGISDDHVELAATLRKWAAELGGDRRGPGARRATPGR